MGLLDLPGILLAPVQELLHGPLPLPLCLGLWATLLAAASMWLYRRTSNQEELARIKPLRRQAGRALAVYDGPFAGLWPLIRRNLVLSARQLRLTLGPSLIAAVPLLLALPWLSNTFSHAFPEPGERVRIAIETATPYSMYWGDHVDATRLTPVRWEIGWPGSGEETSLYRREQLVATLPPAAPVPILHKRQWWNLLVDNPAGHLGESSPAEAIQIDLPEHQYLPWGPASLRGWLPFFLLVTVTATLVFKIAWRIR